MSTTGSVAARRILRATALTVLSLAAAAATWRLRPALPSRSGPPDAAVVAGCAWLAWALVSYLTVAVASVAAMHLIAPLGGCGRWLVPLTPGRLRYLVDRAITVGLATTVVGLVAAAPAGAVTHHGAATSRIDRPTTTGALDWPGLTPSPAAGVEAAPTHPTASRPIRPASPPVDVVVRPGDSLWSIAAGRLESSASARSTSIAWHEWYAANRSVIGDDPNLIYPGEQLHPPAGHATAAHAGGAR